VCLRIAWRRKLDVAALASADSIAKPKDLGILVSTLPLGATAARTEHLRGNRTAAARCRYRMWWQRLLQVWQLLHLLLLWWLWLQVSR